MFIVIINEMFGKFSSLSLSRSGSKIKSLPINFYRKHIFVLYIFKPQQKKLCTYDKKVTKKKLFYIYHRLGMRRSVYTLDCKSIDNLDDFLLLHTQKKRLQYTVA